MAEIPPQLDEKETSFHQSAEFFQSEKPAETEVAEAVLQKAADYLRQYRDATDEPTREQIKAAVKLDPEMQALFRDHADLLREKGMADLLTAAVTESEAATTVVLESQTNPSPEATEAPATDEVDLLPIREAYGQLDLKLTSLVTLANEAIVNHAPTASVIFDSEMASVKQRLDTARTATETAQTLADLQAPLTELLNWFDKVESVFDTRFRQLIGGYYGGNPPDGLRAQAKLFTEAKQEIDRLKKYLHPT